jgi:hypothetical protein
MVGPSFCVLGLVLAVVTPSHRLRGSPAMPPTKLILWIVGLSAATYLGIEHYKTSKSN